MHTNVLAIFCWPDEISAGLISFLSSNSYFPATYLLVMQNLDFNLLQHSLQQTAQLQNQDEQDWVRVENEEGSKVKGEV
jgi:hypothetical protein